MKSFKNLYELANDEIEHLFWKHKERILTGVIILLFFLVSFVFGEVGTYQEIDWGSEYRQMQVEENYNI